VPAVAFRAAAKAISLWYKPSSKTRGIWLDVWWCLTPGESDDARGTL